MWHDLPGYIEAELARLRKEIAAFRTLVAASSEAEPDAIETAALAAMAQAVYTGIETIMRLIAEELDGDVPRGGAWHRRLLDQMTEPREARPALLADETHAKLVELMGFRHAFRHSYPTGLRWDRMRDVVLSCGNTVEAFAADVDAFLASLDDAPDA